MEECHLVLAKPIYDITLSIIPKVKINIFIYIQFTFKNNNCKLTTTFNFVLAY